MNEPQTESQKRARRRWINLGEFIALAALILSGLGLWNSWQDGKTGPTEVIEKPRAIALVLRGKAEDDGRHLVISPVEDSHALESLILTFPGGKAVELGGDGALESDTVEAALPKSGKRKGDGSITAKIDAGYIEAGSVRRSAQHYVIRYRWEGGGLFGGKSLRLTGLARA